MDIRRFLHLNKLELFGLIETRVKHNKWKKVSNFISDCWSVCTNHQSRKGGRIWVLWNLHVLTLDIQHISAQTIHAKITDRGRNLTYWVTFVYGYNKAAERKVLWSTLEHYHQVTPGAWLIGGDFNNVLFPNERIGANITSAEMAPFQRCVQACGVEDIKAVSSFFTWTNKQEANSRVYSRIDRALINDAWLHLFPESFANFLSEGMYDHCPCLIQLESNDKARNISFKYFNMWAKSHDFLGIITKHWNAPIYGTHMYKVVKRMKAMKSDLKQLKSNNFHDVIKNAQIMLMTLHNIQAELQTRPSDPQLIEAEKAELMALKPWIKQGFLFWLKRQKFPGVHLPTVRQGPVLTEHHYSCLTKPVTGDEVRRVLFSIPGCLGVIGADVTAAVQDFFITGQLLKQTNNTTLTLIPKFDMPKSVTQFRHIACCNLIYKCIAKVLCNRLGQILLDIISPTQSAFIKDRDIVENILICQDLTKLYNRKHCSPRVIMKLDLQNAYDSIEWDFMEGTLKALKFPTHFTKLLMECVTTPHYSLSLNGESFGYFKGKRGLRQGDPLSPPSFFHFHGISYQDL
ncbi:uncharacterized protein LOC141631273 [Silene latifolia]|uniref:uncharacterized protein LOC141631273 n=1 Tax=Silene latifolia TaxID=37657 RepID=UPI003D78A2DE